MEDLFGQDMQVYRGQPVHSAAFSTEESDKIFDELIFEGLLLKQMAEALAKVKALKGKTGISLARREAWEELMWVYDLWHTPAIIPFDLACDMAGTDSETIKNAISHEFAHEIQLFFDSVVTRQPTERSHLIAKLRHYIDLREEMH